VMTEGKCLNYIFCANLRSKNNIEKQLCTFCLLTFCDKLESKEDKHQECSVCYEEVDIMFKMPNCTHYFCKTCIVKLSTIDKIRDLYKTKCPLCRTKSKDRESDSIRRAVWLGIVSAASDIYEAQVDPVKPLYDENETITPVTQLYQEDS